MEIKKAKTITRTVSVELTKEQVETIVAEHVMREHRSELRDFGLRAEIHFDIVAGEPDHFACVVTGTATKES